MDNVQNLNKPDELDPLILVEKGLSFIRNFGMIILVFGLLGLGLGLLSYFKMPKQYASRLILHSVVLTNQEQIEIVETWSDLLKKGETATLAQILNMDITAVKKLSKISAVEIQKLYIQNNPNGFLVDVLVKDTAILDEMQNGIVYGLESSYYVRERVTSKKANLNDLIGKVKGEISKLALTKNSVDSLMTSKSGNASSLMIDVSGLNSQWIGLNEKLLGYQEELRFANAVQVLQGFNKLSKPEKPKLFRSIFFGLVGGVFIGYIVALYKSVRRKLKSRAQSRLQPV